MEETDTRMLQDTKLLRFLGFNTQGDLGPWTFYTSKRKGLVFFQKSPPLEPPSFLQTHQRNKFRLTAMLWAWLTLEQKANWELVSKRLSLRITGYNLFTYYVTTGDEEAIETVQTQAGIDLLPLERTP